MALTITVVKRFRPNAGVRRGIVAITFDDQGPTWTVTPADFKLRGLYNLILPAQIDGFVLSYIPTSNAAGGVIEGREEADGASALQQLDAGNLETKVVRVEYVGY